MKSSTQNALAWCRMLLGLAIAFTASTVVGAAENISASPWMVSDHARIRLVPGALRADGGREIGVHIELDEGWHTYWRNPGASGVPPRFDWSKSSYLASAKVRWPAPRRLKDDYGVSFGYLDEVVFPVTVTPSAQGRDVQIRLTVDFAVCREICIPEFAELTLALPSGGQARPVYARLVARFDADVPRPQHAEMSPRIELAQVELQDGKPVLAITVAVGSSGQSAELFVEGPEEYYFTAPDGPELAGDGSGKYLVKISGVTTVEDLKGAHLRCTLVTASGAVEHVWIVQ